ncbi:hypothetical protein KC959_00135 [Candidatus Saccharibacteria bacterium]|nr:hypothetical protein [Candidatus Saccharibacteria bacterium]
MQPQQNPYDFILDPQAPKKGPGLAPTDGKKRLVLIIGFLAGVAVVLIVGVSILFSLGKANNDDLIRVRARQVELGRIIEIGLKNSTDADQRNRLTTLQATLATDQAALSDLLSKRSVEVTKLQLAAYEDSDRDAELETARQNGKLTDTLSAVIAELSSQYYKELKGSLAEATTDTEKSILQTSIDNLELVSQEN